MSRFLHEDYQALTPYTPGEQPKDKIPLIKLNTNESPYPPSPAVAACLNKELAESLRLYPDPELSVLREALAEKFGVGKENVFCGNGSDDVLAFSIMAFTGRGGEIAAPDISYGFYPVYAAIFGAKLLAKPLRADLSVDPADFIGIHKNIVIANPNAPTGLVLSIDVIEEIVRSNPDHVVIIDEAYGDFWGESAAPLVKKYDNLIVVQTFSKSRSLAGLRVGFALASEALIADLDRMKFSFNPYNLSRLTLSAACAALSEQAYYDQCVDEIKATREYVKEELKKLSFSVTDSKANFVFASHPSVPGAVFMKKLREKGFLVRYFNQPRIDNYLRITIGTPEQMQLFIKAVQEIIQEG